MKSVLAGAMLALACTGCDIYMGRAGSLSGLERPVPVYGGNPYAGMNPSTLPPHQAPNWPYPVSRRQYTTRVYDRGLRCEQVTVVNTMSNGARQVEVADVQNCVLPPY